MSWVGAASLEHVLLAAALDRGGTGKKEHVLLEVAEGDGGGGARSGRRHWSTSRSRRRSNGVAEREMEQVLVATALVRDVRGRRRRRSTGASGGRRGQVLRPVGRRRDHPRRTGG